MEEIQDKEKEQMVLALCNDIINTCKNNATMEYKTYFDYDSAIDLLKQTKEVIEETLCCPRPEKIPEDIPWSERFYDGNTVLNPYVFDGSMSIEDFERFQDLILDEEENEI